MRRLVAALVAFGLVACGNGDSRARVSGQPTVAEVADRLGCVNLEIETDGSQRELGAREEGSCQFAGEDVQILTYNENTARDAINDMARQFGSISVLGDRWAVRVDSDATAKKVQAVLGGELA